MKAEAIQKRWYKESEACLYTGFGREYLRAARNAGRLAFREWKDNKRIVYDREDLDRFVESNTNLYKSVEMSQRELAQKKRKNTTYTRN